MEWLLLEHMSCMNDKLKTSTHLVFYVPSNQHDKVGCLNNVNLMKKTSAKSNSIQIGTWPMYKPYYKFVQPIKLQNVSHILLFRLAQLCNCFYKTIAAWGNITLIWKKNISILCIWKHQQLFYSMSYLWPTFMTLRFIASTLNVTITCQYHFIV